MARIRNGGKVELTVYRQVAAGVQLGVLLLTDLPSLIYFFGCWHSSVILTAEYRDPQIFLCTALALAREEVHPVACSPSPSLSQLSSSFAPSVHFSLRSAGH